MAQAFIPTGPVYGASVDDVFEPQGFATCPACHVVDATVTNAALAVGCDWRCRRCGQMWDKRRLATVAAYDVWESARQTRRTSGRETTRNQAVPRAL